MHFGHEAVEQLLTFFKSANGFRQFGRKPGTSQFQSAIDFLQNHLFAGHLRMQLKAHIADANVVQPSFDHFQRSHFFGNEQNRLAGCNRRRNQVCDGLRFPGARRALNDQVATSGRFFNHQRLRTVTVNHMPRLRCIEQTVDAFVALHERLHSCKPILKQRADQRTILKSVFARPVVRIQIAIHQQLRK